MDINISIYCSLFAFISYIIYRSNTKITTEVNSNTLKLYSNFEKHSLQYNFSNINTEINLDSINIKLI